jgi:hypothetical protein
MASGETRGAACLRIPIAAVDISWLASPSPRRGSRKRFFLARTRSSRDQGACAALSTQCAPSNSLAIRRENPTFGLIERGRSARLPRLRCGSSRRHIRSPPEEGPS